MKRFGKNRFRVAGWTIAALLLLPAIAHANPITFSLFSVLRPLRLIIANVIIGVLEGCVVGLYNKMEIRSCCYIMTAANFFSALLWACLAEYTAPSPGIVWLGKNSYDSLSLWTLYFLGAVVLEVPFCWWLLREEEHPFKQTIISTLFAQAVSYAMILLWIGLTR